MCEFKKLLEIKERINKLLDRVRSILGDANELNNQGNFEEARVIFSYVLGVKWALSVCFGDDSECFIVIDSMISEYLSGEQK